MRRVSVVLLLAVVALAGCSAAPSIGGSTAECTSDMGDEHYVRYTQDGFSPQKLTITQCDTVLWETGGPDMWVASNRHPTHTQYPGSSIDKCESAADGEIFDSCKVVGMADGYGYRFTFDSTGTWKYHNHVDTNHGGTIVVKPR